MDALPRLLPPTPLRRQRALQWLLVAVLAGVTAQESPRAYGALKLWRAHLFIAEAEDFIRKKNPNEAFARVQAAFQLAPADDRVLRLSARMYASTKHPQAIVLWRQLLNIPGASKEDRRNYVELALDTGMPDLATFVIQRWIAEETEHSIELLLMARFFLLKGNLDEARRYALRGAEKRPADLVTQLYLARLLLSSSTPGEARIGMQKLWSLAGETSAVGIEAIELLARREDITKEQSAELAKQVESHPLKRVEDELLVRDLRLRFEPGQFFSILDDTVGRFRNASQSDRLVVGRWLNRKKSFARTLELVPISQTLTNRDAFVLRLDALAAMDQWKQIGGELDVEPNPLDPAIREVFRARVAMELGLASEARTLWRKVHIEAGQSPQLLFYIAQYAERIGAKADAEQAYRRLATFPESARDAFINLLRMANESQNTRLLREILKEMRVRFPEDPSVENDWAYISLLQNESVQEARVIAEKLHELNPSFLAYRTTLALARLRQREMSQAKKVYEGLILEWTLAPAGWQAVHAAVHGANGNAVAAREFIAQIPIDKLRPEERSLIQPWLP